MSAWDTHHSSIIAPSDGSQGISGSAMRLFAAGDDMASEAIASSRENIAGSTISQPCRHTVNLDHNESTGRTQQMFTKRSQVNQYLQKLLPDHSINCNVVS